MFRKQRPPGTVIRDWRGRVIWPLGESEDETDFLLRRADRLRRRAIRLYITAAFFTGVATYLLITVSH